MKILVNGNIVSEMICEKVVKVRDFRRSELVVCNFTVEDMSLVEREIDHIKINKVMYVRLVVMTALMIHFNTNFVFANEFADSLDSVGNQIISLLLVFAKWGCIGRGLQNMGITMLNGGNLKQAMTEGMQYLLGYLFIELYPQLFDLFKGIKF